MKLGLKFYDNKSKPAAKPFIVALLCYRRFQNKDEKKSEDANLSACCDWQLPGHVK